LHTYDLELLGGVCESERIWYIERRDAERHDVYCSELMSGVREPKNDFDRRLLSEMRNNSERTEYISCMPTGSTVGKMISDDTISDVYSSICNYLNSGDNISCNITERLFLLCDLLLVKYGVNETHLCVLFLSDYEIVDYFDDIMNNIISSGIKFSGVIYDLYYLCAILMRRYMPELVV
jgi:hypothetical protein